MLHAAILRSPVAHGQVATVALAIAEVHAVITAKDYGTTAPHPAASLSTTRVRHMPSAKPSSGNSE
jgi:hypothetical protein